MANLLDEASILLTPTAYDNGSMLAVKPENGDGDISFSRNSAATRVNAQGLVENVQILSSNLVSNGDFSQGGQDWAFSSGASLTDLGAKITHTPTAGSVSQPSVLTIGKSYKLTYEITESVSGGLKFNSAVDASMVTTVGVHTKYLEADATTISFSRTSSSNNDVTITNISILEITDDTDIPRIDYTDGCGSLLLEPQSTNSINYSEPTSSETSASGITYESFNWAIGFTNCIKFGDNSQTRYRYFSGTIANSTEYTISAFVIMDDLSEPILGTGTDTGDLIFRVGGQSATTGNQPNVNMGNNIYRLSSVITSASGGGSTGLLKYAGQSNKGFRIVSFQVEQNSYATSYIPTSGAISTRLQDIANNSGNASLINSEEGVLYAEIATLANDLTNRFISISNGSKAERVEIGYSNVSNKIFAFSNVGNVNQCNISFVLPNMLDYNKIALKYKLNDFSLWVNGVKVGVDLNASVSAENILNELAFDEGDGTDVFYSKTKALAVFPYLTDEQLTALTTI